MISIPPPRQQNDKLPHCAVRAQERYGITLNYLDIRAMAQRCQGGEGLMETKPDGVRYHTLIVGERVLWLVYRTPEAAGRKPYGSIVTIMPPGIGNYRAMRDNAFMRKRLNRPDQSLHPRGKR